MMCAYNKINGEHCSQNQWLLTDVLRKEWGYDGLVTTDWGAYSTQRCELMAGNDIKMFEGNNPIWTAYGEFDVSPMARKSVKRLLEFILRFK